MTDILYHNFNNCTTCQAMVVENARLQAELDDRAAIDREVGFGVLNATETLRQVRKLASGPALLFDCFRSDVKDLKLWNSATGHQPRTDEFYRPAFAVREGTADRRTETQPAQADRRTAIDRRADAATGDVVLAGKTENGGDGLIHVFAAGHGWAAMERILSELRRADVAPAERQRYVRLAAQKRWGPILGLARAGLYQLGWAMLDHPTLTVVGFASVARTDLEQVYYADTGLFTAKLAGRDGMILQGVLGC